MAVGLTVAIVSALVCAAVVWALSPHLGRSLSVIGRSPVDASLFLVGAALSNAASVLDAIAIGLHRSRVQLARNTASSGLRLAFVLGAVLLGVRSTTMLLLAWVVSLGVSTAYSSAAFGLWRSPLRLARLIFNPHIIRRYRVLALRHHALNLAITSVTYFLPVLAALLLIPTDYAYFSIAQLVASAALVIPALLAMTLFAEATGSDALLRRHIRRTLPIGFGCCAILLAIFEPAAPWVLSIFGRAYAEHGTATLRLLLLGGIPYVVKDHWVAIRRAQRRLAEAARWVACAMVFEAAAAATGGAMFGLTGLCGLWVLAAFLEVPFFLPGVVGIWRLKSPDAEVDLASAWAIAGGPVSPVAGAGDLWWNPTGGFTPGVGRGARAPRDAPATTADRSDAEQWWW
jgi:O-antigen/teichoic acid export membrane protein